MPGYSYSIWVELKIKDALRTALYQRDRLIRLPARQIDAARRLQWVENQLVLTLGRAPTSRELAQAMQVQERKLASLLCLEDYTPCSLHTPIEDEEDNYRLLLDGRWQSRSKQPAHRNNACRAWHRYTRCLGK
jgi:RNA polymerase primary sigma factor